MIFERTLIFSLHTAYSIYLRMVVPITGLVALLMTRVTYTVRPVRGASQYTKPPIR